MYFHDVYGSDRRRYGGAGRNSPKINIKAHNTINSNAIKLG